MKSNTVSSGEGVDGRSYLSNETCTALGVEECMQTLGDIAKQARQDKKRRFTNLSKRINHEFLLECFKLLNKNAATGIDGISAREYRQNLYGNVILAIGSICTHTFLAYVYVKSENVWVASVAHITLDNVARSFAYFIILQNQTLANIGLTVTMLIVVAVFIFPKNGKFLKIILTKKNLKNEIHP
jgi:hypothetical protein